MAIRSSAVARIVASRNLEGFWVARSATRFCVKLAALGLLATLGITLVMPKILSSAPLHIRHDAQLVVVALGISSCFVVAASGAIGAYLGQERLLGPGVLVVTTKTIGALAVIVLAHRGYGLLALGFIWASVTMAVPILLILRMLFSRAAVPTDLSSTEVSASVRSFAHTFSLWAFAGFLVSGLDTTIVAHFSYTQAAPYALGAVLPLLLHGGATAAMAPLIPKISRLQANLTDGREIALQTLGYVRTNTAFFTFLVTPLLAWSPGIATLLTGKSSNLVATVLSLLLIATWLRLSIYPFALAVLALDDHHVARPLPLAEGLGNLSSSLVLGAAYGAKGVAIGTIIGAGAGVLANQSYLVPRLKCMTIDDKLALIKPLLRWLPLMLCGTGCGFLNALQVVGAVPLALALTIVVAFLAARQLVVQHQAARRR